MDAELVNDRALGATSDNGQSQRASDGEQSQDSRDGQTSPKGGQSGKQKDNIAALQSMYDQKIAQMEKSLQDYQRAFAEAQRRVDEMEYGQAPDDYTRMEIKARKAEERAAQLEALVREAQEEKARAEKRETALTNIALKYGVDKEDIRKATNYEEAVEMAILARDKKRARESAEQEDKEERNSFDVGGGRTSTRIERLQDDLKKAQLRRDSGATIRIQRLIKEAQAATAKK